MKPPSPLRPACEPALALRSPPACREMVQGTRRGLAGTSLTVGPTGGLLGSLAGISSGSGSARLGLSQKGDLPSSGEPVGFCWFKVANARRPIASVLESQPWV